MNEVEAVLPDKDHVLEALREGRVVLCNGPRGRRKGLVVHAVHPYDFKDGKYLVLVEYAGGRKQWCVPSAVVIEP